MFLPGIIATTVTSIGIPVGLVPSTDFEWIFGYII